MLIIFIFRKILEIGNWKLEIKNWKIKLTKLV
jgi:hypothetical protein